MRLPNAFNDGDKISIEAVGSATSKKGATDDVSQKLLSIATLLVSQMQIP